MLKPIGDRVVVRPKSAEEMTKSGIILPDTAKERPQEGEVMAVGTGRIMDDGTVCPAGSESRRHSAILKIRRYGS
jgi:chaperonin GroES